MSRENVEVVRRAYAAQGFAGGRPLDPAALAAILEVFDPDVELLPGIARSVTGASYRGHAGFRQWVEDMREAWEDFRAEPIEFIDAGDRVLVDVRTRARGRTSTVELERESSQVWTFRHGKVVRFETFTDRRRALEAASFAPRR
jgi:ketosteroid isomerase-like protein